MSTGRKSLFYYFLVLLLLSTVGQTFFGIVIVAILTLGYGIPLVLAAPTLLVYSVVLLPAWFGITHPRFRAVTILTALLLTAGVAIAPGAISQTGGGRYAANLGSQDFAQTGFAKPEAIEFIGADEWGVFEHSFQVGDQRAPCSVLCRMLLFNREVGSVRMTKQARGATPQSVTYRLEHRDICPLAYDPHTSSVEKAFRDRLGAGECLIAEAGSTSPMEASVNFMTTYDRNRDDVPPADTPPLTRIDSIKHLVIERREEADAKPVRVVTRNETKIAMMTLPFYFGHEESMSGRTGPVIMPLVRVTHPINLVDILRETFGFKIAPIEPPN
jgi:hypothetical protein